MNIPRRGMFAVAISLALVIAAVAIPPVFLQEKSAPFISTEQVNAYTQENFGFSFKSISSANVPIAIVCNDKAPKNPAEAALDQYTYCQNNGNPVKASFAWKKAETKNRDYLQRIANTVMKSAKNSSGNFACIEDKSFTAYRWISGTLSDCTITADDGKIYYYSAFFFSPDLHSEISQVIYMYSSHENSDEAIIKDTIRNLVKGLVFESAEKKPFFFSSFFSVETAYASGGSGSAGSADGGSCSADGAGCDGDAGTSSGGGDACVSEYYYTESGISCSECNVCGYCGQGWLQCNGSCSGGSAPALPPGYGTSCSSAPNSCGVTNSGTIQCDGSCDADTPAVMYDTAWCQSIGWDYVTDQCAGYCACDPGRTYVDTADPIGDGRGGQCTAVAAPINGICGPANNGWTATEPTTDHCSAGTFSGIVGTSSWWDSTYGVWRSGWTWSCYGINGGTDAGCRSNESVAATPAPVVDLKINSSNGPLSLTRGAAKNITWITTDATSCTAFSSDGFSGSKSVPSGSESLPANTTSNHTLTCTGPGGTGSDSVQVNVSCTQSCGVWSGCSAACGGGTQTRSCTNTSCLPYSESQACNTQACTGDFNWREVAP